MKKEKKNVQEQLERLKRDLEDNKAYLKEQDQKFDEIERKIANQ